MGDDHEDFRRDGIAATRLAALLGKKTAVDVVMTTGATLPVVGGLIELLDKVRLEFQKLAAKCKEVEEVQSWAQAKIDLLVLYDRLLQARITAIPSTRSYTPQRKKQQKGWMS